MLGRRAHFRQIGDDCVSPVAPQCFCLTHAVNTDHPREVAVAPRSHAGDRILEHRSLIRRHVEQLSATQERIRGRLDWNAFFPHGHPVDAHLDVVPADAKDWKIDPFAGATFSVS